MSRIAARVVLAASVLTLAAVAVMWVDGRGDDPRVDLVGEAASSLTPASPTPPVASVARSRSAPAPSIAAGDADAVDPIVAAPSIRPGMPVSIAIPALDVDAPVVPVGLEPDGSMEIPGATEAGWYHYGVRPGDGAGSAVIAGHVDHARQPGVFIELRRLEVGSEIVVTDTEGVARQFVVAERYQVDKDSLPGPELFRRDGQALLTLITCGGAFDRKQREYADNIIVRAVPVLTE